MCTHIDIYTLGFTFSFPVRKVWYSVQFIEGDATGGLWGVTTHPPVRGSPPPGDALVMTWMSHLGFPQNEVSPCRLQGNSPNNFVRHVRA